MAKAMQPQKMRFSQAIQTPMYKNLVNNTLGDPARGARFIANITSLAGMQPGHDFGRCPFGRKPALAAFAPVGSVLSGAL